MAFKTLLVDNFDSFTYNLYQYLGELGANPLVFRNDEISLKKVLQIKPDRIVISPGPGNPGDKKYFGGCAKIIQNSPSPLLGVCLGHQGIAYAFGGKVVAAPVPVHGKASTIRHDGSGIFKGVKNPFQATRYHSLVADAESLPECLNVCAESLDDLQIMALEHCRKPIMGVQFHPESFATKSGKKILKNFLDL